MLSLRPYFLSKVNNIKSRKTWVLFMNIIKQLFSFQYLAISYPLTFNFLSKKIYHQFFNSIDLQKASLLDNWSYRLDIQYHPRTRITIKASMRRNDTWKHDEPNILRQLDPINIINYNSSKVYFWSRSSFVDKRRLFY